VYGSPLMTRTAVISQCSTALSAPTYVYAQGLVEKNGIGFTTGSGEFRGCIFRNNVVDLRNATVVDGYGAQLLSNTQIDQYLNASSCLVPAMGVTIFDLGGVAGYLGRWNGAGYTKSAAYSAGTHGTPPVTPPTCVHVTTCQNNDLAHVLEIPLWCVAGQKLAVTLYAKQAATGFNTRAKWELIDPAIVDGVGTEIIGTTGEIVDNTDWQTFTLTGAARTTEGPIFLRLSVTGGTATGSGGDDILYWFQVVQGGALIMSRRNTLIGR
jgi:hypothetical protein